MKIVWWLLTVAAVSGTAAKAEAGSLSATSGLTYHLYENAALAGTPSETGTTLSAELSLAKDSKDNNNFNNCYSSGELVGTAIFANEGVYTFLCRFANTSTGWVWIDGHLVCGDGSAYLPRDEIDSRLPMRNLHKKNEFPMRAHITSNATSTASASSCARLKVYWKRDPLPESISKEDKKESPNNNNYKNYVKPMTQEPTVLLTTQTGEETWMESDVTFQPRLSASEEKREELQRSLQQGWGYWLRTTILSMVKLPEGLVMTFQLCQRSSGECVDATATPGSAGTVRVGLHAYDRSYVGYNLTFRNLTLLMECSVSGPAKDELQFLISPLDCGHNDCADFELRVEPRYAWFRPGSVSASPDGDITFATPGLGDTKVTVVLEDNDAGPRREYDSTTSQKVYRRLEQQQPRRSVENATDTRSLSSVLLKIPLGNSGQKVGFVAGGTGSTVPSISELQATIRAHRGAEQARIRHKFGAKAAVAEAIQCAVMWTLIYNPVENGPFMPVSRSANWAFGDKSGATTQDWTYSIFAWDNLFASLLAGLDNRDIAYSNLFQVVKGKTAEGFIPNWSTGGVKSQDRTEPPVGAKVLLELFRKYNDTWIVEALFDDLVDWNDWFVAKRILQPLGLIGLGSHYAAHTPGAQVHILANTMQAARYESGLDNSPMYDGDLYDNSTHMMLEYDVGMSSLFAQEAYSLAELADAIGKDQEVGIELRNRGDVMRDLIWHYMWDPKREIFANRFVLKNSFVEHVTPTSFYPMAIGAGNKEQKNGMVESWLLNSSRFCISPNGHFEGNEDGCYWGLPSVSADDPTYMKSRWVYWRGYTWGPMSQLVYWSLQTPELTAPNAKEGNLRHSFEDDSSSVLKARKALCSQMEDLMMSQWNANRHICENYDPHKNATECSGDNFYHWGALNGLIGMMEEGFW